MVVFLRTELLLSLLGVRSLSVLVLRPRRFLLSRTEHALDLISDRYISGLDPITTTYCLFRLKRHENDLLSAVITADEKSACASGQTKGGRANRL